MRLIYKGNVHEVYELTDKVLIIVRTDRISVHGRLLPMEIKNKGIILAEKHYLPVDKRGNVNVLVVGRFRFW